MELRRGKTFIKSSLQISHEKPLEPVATAPAREGAGPPSVSSGGQPWPPGERPSQVSPGVQGHDKSASKGVQLEPDAGAPFRLVRKSKTHDNVSGAAERLVGSASFSEPSGNHRMIDYRHFVPQMPFVPAVAKSIPRKRISLKGPKKCFRNLFHIRRSKTENLASLETKGKGLLTSKGPLDSGVQPGKALFPLGEGLGLEGQSQDLFDLEPLPEASFDLCRVLCEDVASLKSFDSLTGCGEIFADESSAPCLELNEGPGGLARAAVPVSESKAPRSPFQGGVEQLASPAQHEASDFAKFWDSVNHSVRKQQRALAGPWRGETPEADTGHSRPDTAGLAELPLYPCRDPHGDSKASSIDTGTPKSEQPESLSTSDEGYYDSFSPGLEEDKKEALSPGTPSASFPRDSYSGDALYELFCDPSQGPDDPSLDNDLCVSESLSGPVPGAALSMCSFHMGAEENLAPAPGPELLGPGFLQSSWKGKECLLKLCDTELAITMGIINWLRRGPELHAPAPPAPSTPGEPAGGSRGAAEKLGTGAEQPGQGPGKLEGAGRSPTGSAAGTQGLWAHSGPPNLLVGESGGLGKAKRGTGSLSGERSLEQMRVSEGGGTSGGPKGAFSAVDPAAPGKTDALGRNKAPQPSAWPSSLGCLQGLWGPGLGGADLDTEPTLAGCVAQVAALQIHEACQTHAAAAAAPLTQDMGATRFGLTQARRPDILQQKQPSGFRGLPALFSPAQSPQDPRCPGYVLNWSQLRVEPARLEAQFPASMEDPALWLSLRAPGGRLDS
ncbi:APC membrane recruitment protein 3 [Sorex araneus]|uniref:APC membrane recruitment protein 3 n=1 Tax=Sorex araneus TaxID=42254 RepID=UPI0024336468|nr:APC membrane recruitment protein 3 [Sorex araneus]XP_054983729.1 APC membrane recruitment protein 3 [Sorex araneus]